jgi:hypothetical protein
MAKATIGQNPSTQAAPAAAPNIAPEPNKNRRFVRKIAANARLMPASTPKATVRAT